MINFKQQPSLPTPLVVYTTPRLLPFNSNSLDSLNVTLIITDELLGQDTVLSWVLAELGLHFSVAVVDSEHTRPLRPWVVLGSLLWWLWQQFKVDDGLGSVSQSRADTIVTGITTTNDNHRLATDLLRDLRKIVIQQSLGVEG
ncbi:hypothetical protein WICPIJ_000814 [Wickerhamomyces pijperi]|uniref:Uncharacterized protein n=1 Tax=Wickerhamomyces pijperi TaxID=599730 RepID=A0A9P8QBV3_WICPI|nr:hypothetical protein WICPIJ_000814 [Wickerhamomyces pijperi]